jgi:hypothetical protein
LLAQAETVLQAKTVVESHKAVCKHKLLIKAPGKIRFCFDNYSSWRTDKVSRSLLLPVSCRELTRSSVI